MATDLAKAAKDKSLRYFLISYTDLFGKQRAKLVPAAAIGEMQKAGAAFAGFATWARHGRRRIPISLPGPIPQA